MAGSPEPLAAQSTRSATAVRIPAGSVEVDGRLDEEAWSRAEPISDFVQKEPVEGASPTERTEMRFVYDDEGLYVGARMQSSGGREAIQAPLGRRDSPFSPGEGEAELAEYVLVSLDTFLDRRTAYSFGVTASGVRIDHQHLTDSESDIDARFDPVWDARTTVDDGGWTAEMWIPFAQLRFNSGTELVFGLNAHRWIPSKNEDDYWVAVPRTDDAWSSRFGSLRGIERVSAGRRVELLPYASGGSTLSEASDPLDPFHDDVEVEGRIGGDLKMGLGPNLTLDATFLPDFGHVEVDPAVINLTDMETFYPERRPFFTEGSSLLDGPQNNYFYSRRIGQRPEGPASGDFVDYPGETTILGATKLTGRLPSGTSLGILGAVTAEEHARVFELEPDAPETGPGATGAVPGTLDEVRVGPRTAWGVARIQQEFGGEGSTWSLMTTGVRRKLAADDPLAAHLPRTAASVAGETFWRLDGGTYEVSLSGGLTRIGGEEAAIVLAQHGSERYFQRPDADHVRVDSSRTSLSGAKATLQARKISGEHWLWNVFLDVESPEVTFNDVGRLGAGDGVMTNESLTYRETEPGERLRSYSFTVGQSSEWNFGGVRQHTRLDASTNLMWDNYWRTRISAGYDLRAPNHRLTRGGPIMETPRGWRGSLSLQSNPSARTRWQGSVSYGRDELGGWNGGMEGSVSLVPGPRWQISFAPSFERLVDSRQYVTLLDGGPPATYGKRYVFAFTDRTTLAVETRLDLTLKPDLNLELFAQPFASSARYFDFGELDAAGSRSLREYGSDGTSIRTLEDGTLEVTDGGDAFTLPLRDFNLRSFRSTAVLRWEWRPGSTLFLVWQQDRSRRLSRGVRSGLGDLLGSLGESGDDFFAVKVSYWIGL